MKLVVLNGNVVVAIEENGVVDTSVEHTKIISVDDEEYCELGWEYFERPIPTSALPLFYNPTPAPHQKPPSVQYAVDENGNQYVVPEETA